ncbi:Protein of unknown function (DUF3421) [Popillia japonica]|uniref:Uncharacterized protein n=1 Tax=Popillia japonica TaxID=7064 RepID=A0AAW1KF60_POPJA
MSTVFFYLILIAITSLNWNAGAISPDIFWRDYVQSDIPCDAIEAAPGRYIGQAYHNGFMVATLYSYSNVATFDFGGKKTAIGNLKILCSHQPEKLYWEKVNFSAPLDGQMTDAVKGGNQANQFDLYIGIRYSMMGNGRLERWLK